MRMGSIYIRGQVVGTIYASLGNEEDLYPDLRSHMFTPPFFGVPGTSQGRGGQTSPSGRAPDRPHPSGPTFRPGVRPGDREREQPADREHMKIADIQSAVKGGVIRPYKEIPTTKGGEGEVDRSSFAAVRNDPALVKRLASMVKGEVGLNAHNKTQQAILEEAFNRWYVRNQPAGHDLYSGKGGYYAASTFRSVSPEEVETFRRNVLEPVLGGSNVIKGMTGNASNEPGNMVALHQFQHGTPGFWMDLKTGEKVDLPPNYIGGKAEAMFEEGPFNRQLAMKQGAPSVADAGPSETRGIGRQGPVPPQAEVGGIKPEFPYDASKVNVSRMKPELIARLNEAYRAAPAGQKFEVISGYRPATRAEARQLGMQESSSQEDIWARSRGGTLFPSSHPGHSRHQAGEAADISGPGREWLVQRLGQFGLEHAIPSRPSYDRYHVQLNRNDPTSRVARGGEK